MGVTNEYERDFNDQSGLKRPGRIDLVVFQNVPDAGDGHPGIQRCFRNYLHTGGMEYDLNMNSLNIDNLVDMNISGEIVFPSATIHSSGTDIHIHPNIGNADGNLILHPVGTNTASVLFVRNSVTGNYGDFIIKISDGVASLESGSGGAGSAPTTLNINNANWDNINIGDATASISLNGVTFIAAEFTQLSNINSVTINNTQWGYLGASNQGIATSNTPSFAGLGLTGNLTLAANSITGTSVDINNAEMQQLSNIGTNTISGTQWGYLGGMNQNVRTSDSPSFNGITLTGNISMAANSIIGTSVDINNVELQQLSNIGTATISGGQWGYLGAMNQDVHSTASPTFAALALNGDVDMNSNSINELKDVNDSVYYVATDAEFDAAITAIGGGDGKIIVTADLTGVNAEVNNSTANIVIEGAGAVTLNSVDGSDLLIITNCNSIIIRNLTIDTTAQTTTTYRGIYIIAATHAVVDGCYFVGDGTNGRGITSQVDNLKVSNCTFISHYIALQSTGVDCSITGCHIYDAASWGIAITSGGDRTTITGCTIDLNSTSNTIEAIYIAGSQHVTISGCTIYNAGSGIYGDSSSHYLTVNGCAFDTNASGGGDSVEFLGDHCSVNGCTFWDCTQAVTIANGAEHCAIVGNVFTGDATWSTSLNKWAITTDGDYTLIVGNNIADYQEGGSGTGYGIWIQTGCTGCLVVGNNCVNTEDPLREDGTNTRIDTSDMTSGANLNYLT